MVYGINGSFGTGYVRQFSGVNNQINKQPQTSLAFSSNEVVDTAPGTLLNRVELDATMAQIVEETTGTTLKGAYMSIETVKGMMDVYKKMAGL